jgi:hypothetical protein
MFPVCPGGLALQVPNPEEDQGIQPTLFAGLAKGLLVNPFLEAEIQEPGLDREVLIVDEAWTTFLDCRDKP